MIPLYRAWSNFKSFGLVRDAFVYSPNRPYLSIGLQHGNKLLVTQRVRADVLVQRVLAAARSYEMYRDNEDHVVQRCVGETWFSARAHVHDQEEDGPGVGSPVRPETENLNLLVRKRGTLAVEVDVVLPADAEPTSTPEDIARAPYPRFNWMLALEITIVPTATAQRDSNVYTKEVAVHVKS